MKLNILQKSLFLALINSSISYASTFTQQSDLVTLAETDATVKSAFLSQHPDLDPSIPFYDFQPSIPKNLSTITEESPPEKELKEKKLDHPSQHSKSDNLQDPPTRHNAMSPPPQENEGSPANQVFRITILPPSNKGTEPPSRQERPQQPPIQKSPQKTSDNPQPPIVKMPPLNIPSPRQYNNMAWTASSSPQSTGGITGLIESPLSAQKPTSAPPQRSAPTNNSPSHGCCGDCSIM